MKLYSAIYDSKDPFGIFDEVIGCVSPSQLDTDGVLLLHGGEDISPSIYGQRPSSYTHASATPSKRDKKEIAFVNRAQQLGIPIIAICRGAQLVCALSGGKLAQDVSGHEWGKHDLHDENGFVTLTNSIHHQMMVPAGTNHKLIAWCDPKLSDYYITEGDKEFELEVEPEIVFFPELKALAIQGHPEYLTPSNPFVEYCTKNVRIYCGV